MPPRIRQLLPLCLAAALALAREAPAQPFPNCRCYGFATCGPNSVSFTSCDADTGRAQCGEGEALAWARFDRTARVVEAAFADDEYDEASSRIFETLTWSGPSVPVDSVVMRLAVDGSCTGDGAEGYGLFYADFQIEGFGGRGIGGLLNYGPMQTVSVVLEERRPLAPGATFRVHVKTIAQGTAGGRSHVRASFRAYSARTGSELTRCDGATSVTPATWGRLKSIYRR